MLSDGASAACLSDQPNEKGISLRIDWIEGVSYANELETCMYMAAEKQENGSLKSFKDYSSQEIMAQSIRLWMTIQVLQLLLGMLGFSREWTFT